MEGQVKLGMSKEMVWSSWGDPLDICHPLTGSDGRQEWVCGHSGPYLLFKFDELAAWQD